MSTGPKSHKLVRSRSDHVEYVSVCNMSPSVTQGWFHKRDLDGKLTENHVAFYRPPLSQHLEYIVEGKHEDLGFPRRYHYLFCMVFPSIYNLGTIIKPGESRKINKQLFSSVIPCISRLYLLQCVPEVATLQLERRE